MGEILSIISQGLYTPDSVSHASLSCNSCTKIWGWGMQPLVPLFFIICHPYIPLHLEEMIFYTLIIGPDQF